MAFTPGWTYDPAAIEAGRDEFRSLGIQSFLADGRPDLKDYHKQFTRTRNADAELELFGKFLPHDRQQYGTCVARGTYRALQTAYYRALVSGKIAGSPVQLCYEQIYGGSRVQIGQGRLRGAGSYGVWAAMFTHKYGVFPRGVYGSLDLSASREDVAVDWGDRGVPPSVLSDTRSRKGVSCYEATTLEQMCDALAAECVAACCAGVIWGTQRDQNGCCRIGGEGGHCTEFVDFVVDYKSRLISIQQQSWTVEITGPDRIKLLDGSEYQLGPGRFGVYPEEFRSAFEQQGSEIWCFGACEPWTDGINPGEMA